LYLDRFDAPRESLAKVAVKNHRNALDNPNAQFHKKIDAAAVMDSPVVADPLRLYDYCPVTDGSAALLFCPESVAERYADEYAVVTGVAGATDTHVVHERADPTAMDAVAESGRRAFEMADRDPADVDVAELHDMVTLLEILQYEALGFADRGEGWRLIEDGVTERDGDLPVNTSGATPSEPRASPRPSRCTNSWSARRGRARCPRRWGWPATSAASATA
jgi:acetyl-CoA acetyltransferase